MQQPVYALYHSVEVTGANCVPFADLCIGKFIGPVGKEHSCLERPVVGFRTILIKWWFKPELVDVRLYHAIKSGDIGVLCIEFGHIGGTADGLEDAEIRITVILPEPPHNKCSTPGIDIQPGDQATEV